MISFISSLLILYYQIQIFLWISLPVSDAATVNPNGIKMLLANGLSTFPIKGNPAFSDGPKSPPENPSYYPILGNWIFDNLILADEPFAKAL